MATSAAPAGIPGEISFQNIISSMKAFATAGLEPSTARLASITGAQPEVLDALDPTKERIGAELNEGTLRARNNRYFLPLPPPLKDDPDSFFLAFFRPRFVLNDQVVSECDIDLWLFSGHKSRKSFGMRFERGRQGHDTHAYPHLQFTRKFEGHLVTTDLPSELPNSYPAFPTRCRAPGDTWLAMLVSLYGLSDKDRAALSEVVGRIQDAQKLELTDVLIPRARHIFDVPAITA
jgi:hypothetical protein